MPPIVVLLAGHQYGRREGLPEALDHTRRVPGALGHPYRSYQSPRRSYERSMRVYRAAGRSEAPGTKFWQHLEPGDLYKKRCYIDDSLFLDSFRCP